MLHMKEYLEKKWKKFNLLTLDQKYVTEMYKMVEYLNHCGYGSSIKYSEINEIKDLYEYHLKRIGR